MQYLGHENFFGSCGERYWLPIGDGANGTVNDGDGKEYNTVVIGPHHLMTENLNYATDGSFCYNNDTTYCSAAGRLYTWDDAMTACPAGWHLPTADEWEYFTAQTVMEELIYSTDFELRTIGYRNEDGSYESLPYIVSFWSSTDSEDDAKIMKCNTEGKCGLITADKNMAYSVRCFQDEL